MHISTVSATMLAKHVSDILNRVAYEAKPVIILRHGTPVAKIVPAETADTHPSVTATLNRFYGTLPSFPSLRTARRFRRHRPLL